MRQGEKLRIEISAAGSVNFAAAQNQVPIVTELKLANLTDAVLEGLTVSVASRHTTPVIRARTWNIDRLPPNGEVEVSDLTVPIDSQCLSRLNESERGELHVVASGPGGLLSEKWLELELLAHNEWCGVDEMAQLIAAFVCPNDAVVPGLLKDAARILEAQTGSGSLNGYQSGDKQRVWLVAGAIWSAVTGLGLHYANPPPSFEKGTQKVRLPAAIAKDGIATCLDTSLLLAAAYEAAGLNPVILFSRGHAWVGLWLAERDFGYVTEPDVVAVRKAAQALEFVPVESTLLTHRPAVSIREAMDAGRLRLSEEHEDEFLMAVDICRARAARIRPLSSADDSVGKEEAQVPAREAPLPGPLDLGVLVSEVEDDKPDTPQGRIDRWQRKLLDLTLRNRLLNFKDGKRMVPLECHDVAGFEDELHKGRAFKVRSLDHENPVGERKVSPEERKRIIDETVIEAFGRRQIYVPLPKREMEARLTNLYRLARRDLEEGGTNTLFLAAGFLRWQRTEGDTRTFRAPLLLVPAKLERRSAQSGFTIRHHEDEVRINYTLLELLKRDFEILVPGLDDELPPDEHGIDLPRIFQILRARVFDVPGFEVVEDLSLSNFSFSKYLMWKDMVDRQDQLKENQLVAHLIDGDDVVAGPGVVPSAAPREMDERVSPSQVVTPLPYDSSQLNAILAASEGRNFVMEGPPGTGKSQTIANIISQCLANGKTVLFVAEKAAALNVVHRRLTACGLGEAVLELHSNKTERRNVLDQLRRSWDRAATDDGSDWVVATAKLERSTRRLNDYVGKTHAKGTQGFSVFDAIAETAGNAETELSLEFATRDAHDKESFDRLCELAHELGLVHAKVRDRPPINIVEAGDWSNRLEKDLIDATGKLRAAVEAAMGKVGEVSELLGIEADPRATPVRRELLRSLSVRLTEGAPDVSMVPDTEPEQLKSQVSNLARDVGKIDGANKATAADYPEAAVARMPLEDLDSAWRAAQASFWPFSALSRRKVRKLLQTYADSGKADPGGDLKLLVEIRHAVKNLGMNPLLPLAGEDRDVQRASSLVGQALTTREIISNLRDAGVGDSERFGNVVSELISGKVGKVAGAINAYLKTDGGLAECAASFAALSGHDLSGYDLSTLMGEIGTLENDFDNLAEWMRWVRVKKRAEGEGLAELVRLLEQGRCQEDARGKFRRAYMRWWLSLAIDDSETLRNFASWEHERQIERYRELDDDTMRFAPREVMRRIRHGLAGSRAAVPKKSELGILRHQLGLKRPSMAIRKLLGKMPETLPKLAPCMLMSPLSVAQYLPAGQRAFDVVIFDEASQITTWDAIGAIARGRQSIIVGDPKQLPPTNFFGRVEESEDYELAEEEGDMPSILDEVSASGVPTHRLNWHYRSRDESLIMFSNHNYYDERLVTFPAPSTNSAALCFHKVEGTYARGGGRFNQLEAKEIVRMARERLLRWLELPEDERPTLGVITFNSQQQSLILDLLDEERRNTPDLEWYFAYEREEPVIVKNIENIQGDERDVMFFSITFGYDSKGKISMSFGALNPEGGERRLNVAVTRARREMHVVSSIVPEDIDLSRTRAKGVNDLKAFLDYARRGKVALAAREEGSMGPADSPFEEAVAKSLREWGWEVRTQIGVSGFRIDLGIVNPDQAGSYLAGIECDGAQYHSSATARDRDKVRQLILEGLGWKILRIWSTDWFYNPQKVANQVHSQLEELLGEMRKDQNEVAQVQPGQQ